MPFQQQFPVTAAVFRALTGRRARRIYFLLFVVLLATTTLSRLRMYYLAGRAQDVLRGLAEIQIDETTEEQLQRLIPGMERRDWAYKEMSGRNYYVLLTNEDDGIARLAGHLLRIAPMGVAQWFDVLIYRLGYRYFHFGAFVSVEGGKVTHLSYGLANQHTAPRYAGKVGYLVSARSFHGFWLERQYPFDVSSEADVSPQFQSSAGTDGLNLQYAADAPRDLTTRIFQLDLSCFWDLRGCDSPRSVAPVVWQNAQAIRQQADQQLSSGKCPESIVEGRMKYLPDISVSLLEVTGSRRVPINEEGNKTEDRFMDYKLVETLRGRRVGDLKNIRIRRSGWAETQIGAQVLYFSYPLFNSCRFIPATPSAIEIVRRTPVAPKHLADRVVEGLL